jgi:alkyl hydroperoxide reductase subunit AhpC
VSVDSVPTNVAWANSLGGIPFPLLADFHPKGKVGMLYGVYNEDRGTERRSVFVIDSEGVIRNVREYAPGTLPDARQILEEVRALGGPSSR